MTGDRDVKVGGLLLAAGGSRRLGRPKQLIEFEGKTLIRRAAEALVGSAFSPVIAVIGAETQRCTAEISDLSIDICVNENWQTGMSSSIKTGVRRLLLFEPSLSAILITLCDQPRVTSEKLGLFAERSRNSNAPIIAAEYRGTLGVPALFRAELFEDLLKLEGDKGARHIIRNARDIATIKLDEAIFDVDHLSDLEIF